jgi:hypothetical protein
MKETIWPVNNAFIEIEETFTFELSVMSSVGTVDTPNIAAITIAANDDAYGVFKYTTWLLPIKSPPVSNGLFTWYKKQKQ